jgi:hypothetical protein
MILGVKLTADLLDWSGAPDVCAILLVGKLTQLAYSSIE